MTYIYSPVQLNITHLPVIAIPVPVGSECVHTCEEVCKCNMMAIRVAIFTAT